jgi:hypothetical protein
MSIATIFALQIARLTTTHPQALGKKKPNLAQMDDDQGNR